MKIINRRVKFDYQILDKFEAGIVLNGAEVKAVRAKKVNITQAFARVSEGEVFLINANFSGNGVEESTRTRKLLLHKKEIKTILTNLKVKKLTLIPLSLYTRGRLIKLELALAKSKKKHEKKQVLKERSIKREVEMELRGRH